MKKKKKLVSKYFYRNTERVLELWPGGIVAGLKPNSFIRGPKSIGAMVIRTSIPFVPAAPSSSTAASNANANATTPIVETIPPPAWRWCHFSACESITSKTKFSGPNTNRME